MSLFNHIELPNSEDADDADLDDRLEAVPNQDSLQNDAVAVSGSSWQVVVTDSER